MTDRVEAFDCHVHAGPADPGDPLASPPAEVLVRRLAAAGVSQAVIFAPNRRSGYRVANDEVLRIAAADPARWVPFLRMRSARPHPFGRRRRWLLRLGVDASFGADDYPASELATLLGSGGFRGVKLNLAADGMPPGDVLDLLARDGVPVLLHAGEGIDRREVEAEFLGRGIPTILAHMGTYPLRRREAEGWLALLEKHPCAYTDTAAVFFGHVLQDACRRFPTRVLFGTDAPAFDPTVGRAAIDALDMDDVARERILRGNLRELLARCPGEVRT